MKLILHPQTKTVTFSPVLWSEAYCPLPSFAATFTKPAESLRNGVNAIRVVRCSEQPRGAGPHRGLADPQPRGAHSFLHQANAIEHVRDTLLPTNCFRLASKKGPVLAPSTQAAHFKLQLIYAAYVVPYSRSACVSFSYVPREWHCAVCLFRFGPRATLLLSGWIRCSGCIFFTVAFCEVGKNNLPLAVLQVQKHHYRTRAQESKANIPRGFLRTVLSAPSDVYCWQVRLPLCSTLAYLSPPLCIWEF